jgi:serine/threonine protein kinase
VAFRRIIFRYLCCVSNTIVFILCCTTFAGATDADALIYAEQKLSELRHPNIVRVLGKCSGGDGRFCMVLEFATGGSVQSVLCSVSKRAVFSPSTRLYVAHSLASALEYLHGRKMVHRDIKPGNICMYEAWDENPKVVLIDFGIAARISDPQASSTMPSNPGTECFMAPKYADRASCRFTDVIAHYCVMSTVWDSRQYD